MDSNHNNNWKHRKNQPNKHHKDGRQVPLPQCRNFIKSGTCKFGNSCRFSHGITSDNHRNQDPSTRAHENLSSEQMEVKEKYNRWKSLLKTPLYSTQDPRFRRIWNDALAILDSGDGDGQQKLPNDLDSDEYYGREHIRVLMATTIDYYDIEMVKDFLLLFTHHSLIRSLALDTCVGALYNFISGNNGTRVIPFSIRICEALTFRNHLLIDKDDDGKHKTILMALVAFLREVLRREQRARFHDDLPILIDQINELVVDRKKFDTSLQSLESDITWIRSMSMRARDNILDDQYLTGEEPPIDHQPKSAYPRQIEVPGGRHDNDQISITAIQIFPTSDELQSDDPEFLPSEDYEDSTFLQHRAERHIDTQFRLLRYDTFRELKIALGRIFHETKQNPNSMNLTRTTFGDLRAHEYHDAFISRTEFNNRRGLELSITFPLPFISSLRKSSNAERHKWWEESKRLAEGHLLSFIVLDAGQIHHIFLEVVERSKVSSQDWYSSRQHTGQLCVTTKLASNKQADLEVALRLSCAKSRGILLEFPGIIPATFKPILENLQRMQRECSLLFQDWILPAKLEHQQPAMFLDVRSPVYAREPGFSFSLESIMNPENEHPPLQVDPNTGADEELLRKIKDQTTLDLGQCEALVSALTKEFAFIQGPPGTGKSYLGIQLMKVLLDNRHRVGLGPVVVVCYTNHALDQFLEHLIQKGVEKVVRIGGQSRSELLEHHNLREIRKSMGKTKFENYLAAQAYKTLDTSKASIDRGLGRLHGLYKKQPDWIKFSKHLMNEEPQIYMQFREVDDEGFQQASKRPPFEIWANAGPSSAAEINATVEALLQRARNDVYQLSKSERNRLLQHWISELQLDLSDNLFEQVKEASKAFKTLTNIHDETNKRILEDADVIGVTTTGLAKNIAMLRYVKAKVVVCEEAGEVMEPHMLSTLLPSVQHLIQIGDHQQLRPQINSYGLSLESQEGLRYQLDRSQFERLIIGKPRQPKIPVVQLNVQRRMRPEISSLIRETIYSKLVDHNMTLSAPDIVGLRSNVLWLDHRNHEETQQSDVHHKSHSNNWEVSMVQALVRHLIRQGEYKSEDIAILAPYTGQVSKLRKLLNEEYEIVLNDRDAEALEKDGLVEDTEIKKPALAKKSLSTLLRLATVDNFQGEEAKVVIISLVRSNDQQKVGFLKSTNRINVALSRAKHGMYLIGNSETYSGTPMWAKIIAMLRMNENIKDHIELCCPRHNDARIEVKEPEDFQRLSPEGGCKQPCSWRLECGHMCQAPCHSERMHNVFDCSEPCQRFYPVCKHPCKQPTCGISCGRCEIILEGVKLPCGHHQDIVCHRSQNLEEITCKTMIRKTLPGCFHSVKIPCFRGNEIVSSKDCDTPCDQILKCGHICPGKCRECRKVSSAGLIVLEHRPCQSSCKRPFTECGHICNKKCHSGESCGPCTKPCEVRCQHSKCTKLCGEACAPCIEACTWSCDHQGTCVMPCGGPCTRLPCNQRCSKSLNCGHRCPGVCGETCAEAYCQDCGLKSDARVDILEMKMYSEIDVNENPIIILGCGHFFTMESLDGMIGIDKVYSSDQQGNFICTSHIPEELIEQVPRCPDCNCQIKQFVARRYGRLINEAVVEAMTRRYLSYGINALADFHTEITAVGDQFAKSNATWERRVQQLRGDSVFDPLFQERYKAALKLNTKIQKFILKSGNANQPAYKINQAIVLASRKARRESLGEHLASLSIQDLDIPPRPVLTLTLGGRLAQLIIQCLILEDKLSLAIMFEGKLTKPVDEFFGKCTIFIPECFNNDQPKLAIEATINMARLAGAYSASNRATTDIDGMLRHSASATKHLLDAQKRCIEMHDAIKILGNLPEQLERWIKILPRYNEITPAELQSVQNAMLIGRDGLATHSGHWYQCSSGHRVSHISLTSLPFSHMSIILSNNSAPSHSLPSANAVCPWKKHNVRNVELESEGEIMLR